MKRALLAILGAYLLFSGVYLALEKLPSKKAPAQQETPYIAYKEPINADTLYVLVNAERTNAGASSLARNPQLDQAANTKCSDMLQNSYYAHVNPTTGQHGYEIAQAAIQNEEYVSENINRGIFYKNTDVIRSWNESPAHKAAMLDPKYVDTGVAVCSSPAGTTLVVQFFANYLPAQQTSSSTRCTSYTSVHNSVVSGNPYGITRTTCQ